MIKIGVNGFGRIGRNFFRAALASGDYGKEYDIVAVNDIAPIDQLAYMLKWDSVYGKLDREVKAEGTSIRVGDRRFEVTQVKDPAEIPWRKFGVDVVIESTGLFTEKEKAAKHLTAGARKVLISAPGKGSDVTIVLGVNYDMYDKSKHSIVSMASCTTGSLAPPVKVINDRFGIEKGMMTTIHAYTGDQRLVDAPHNDYRRGRAAAVSIIPTSTGAAKAIGEVIPEMKGKLNGFALRVPTPCGSVTDLSFTTKQEVAAEDLNAALKEAADGRMKGIMEYCTEPIVSIDVVGNTHSSIIDSLSTMVIGGKGNFGKILSWYDNEWGYSNRLIELSQKLL
ncbi:MAG: type I glyceraldehyde-3-phosphate dehydrogenase [Euryarchaeota archaeon RBG_19FT_COMBO_56_21]|nr:MAG: type I glyceraldehyde-3-phosphate dehydrogenase [Euryarchaeota archaeon RBG_19FT_COMBO_56_21]